MSVWHPHRRQQEAIFPTSASLYFTHTETTMSMLGDDELALILNCSTDPNDRRSFSEVCKQWMRVEGLTRSSICLLEPDTLLQVLPRFPNLLHFDTSKFITDADLAFISQTCPKLQSINLNFKNPRQISHEFDQISVLDDFGNHGFRALANGCPELRKVSLRRRKNIGNLGILSLVDSTNSWPNLTNLDLGFCSLVSDRALDAIGSSKSIRVLCLQGCSLITDRGLGFLAYGPCSKTMKRLNLSECDRITDLGVSHLRKMGGLVELNLAECGPKVTDSGTVAIAAIQSLKKLNFSWLINVSDATLIALAENCPGLEMVDLTGCELVTGAGIRAFANHMCLEGLVLKSCFNVGASDVEHLALRCWSLKSVVLDKGLKIWMGIGMQQNLSRLVALVWC